MLWILDIGGILLLLQGGAPLIQKMSGTDPQESFFLANAFPENQGLVCILLIIAGIALLAAGQRVRRSRRG
nr:hypothetical protein OG781_31380 [Streptomyces sp. NBC_00830]